MLLLAGCGWRVEPLPAEEAVAHYDAVAEALIAELDTQEWTLNEKLRSVENVEGRCVYTPGIWNADGPLDGVRGDEGWGEVAERLDPVLAQHGFGDLSSPSRSGAMYYVRSHDGHGAELVLDMQGGLFLEDARVETDSCTADALGL